MASDFACEIGINQAYSQLLPQDKVDSFNKIKTTRKSKVVYVGDGINDSPTLAMADVGVAMGGVGSEIAVKSADVVIMDDDVSKLTVTVKVAKLTARTVVQNIIGSLSVKFLIMILSIITPLPVYIAMLSDVGVMILAVLNSIKNLKN